MRGSSSLRKATSSALSLMARQIWFNLVFHSRSFFFSNLVFFLRDSKNPFFPRAHLNQKNPKFRLARRLRQKVSDTFVSQKFDSGHFSWQLLVIGVAVENSRWEVWERLLKKSSKRKNVWKPFHPVGDEEPWEHALVHDTQEFGRRSRVIWIIVLYSQKELKSYYAFFHEHKETT